MRSIKIAFLITAYNDVNAINRLAKQVLQYDGSHVFIHIDKKSAIDQDLIIKSDKINVLSHRIDVSWGDYSQILAIKNLMEYAKEFDNFDYYSVHSESDLLVRPINELINFLSNDNAYAYLWCYPLPYKEWQFGGGLGRIALKWPKIFRKKCRWYSPIRYMRSIYGKLYSAHIIRGHSLPVNIQFYGRCDWFTISGMCVNDILKYVALNNNFDSFFKESLIGSEIYFTTLACLCGQGKKVITDNCLRYIDFTNVDYRYPGSPKELDMFDIDRIEHSGCFFARKFNENHDKDVIMYFINKTNS